jgi:hypothetical protein
LGALGVILLTSLLLLFVTRLYGEGWPNVGLLKACVIAVGALIVWAAAMAGIAGAYAHEATSIRPATSFPTPLPSPDSLP